MWYNKNKDFCAKLFCMKIILFFRGEKLFMAVGDGGFKTAFQGFDKNEVNEYISNLRKKMNELEAEMKDNDSKVKAAVRIADEAEGKIQKLEKANSEKIAELELQIKTERRNAEDLLNQIDVLKRKVKNGGGSSSSGASSAEAQRQAAEIIEKANRTAQETVEAANKTAREVVEKAKQTAKDIVANAQSVSAAGGAVASVNLDGFMSEVKSFLEQINSGYKKICERAEEISVEETSAPAPAPVEIPDFSDVAAPAAEAPMAEVPTTEVFDFKEPEQEPTPEFSFEDISELSSDSSDLSDDDDMMAGFGSLDEPVTEVKENDTSEHSKAAFDMDFDKELIAQTVPSSSLNENEIDEDLLAAVREEEAKHAVQPTPEEGRRDFDMDMSDDDGADAMRKMLEAAEAAFGGGSSGTLDFDTDTQMDEEPAPEPEKADNPWEDLQKQLEAMEQSGNFGEAEPEPAPEPEAKEPELDFTETDDRPTPTTDDSSIWDFSSSDSSSDDDDMSGDIFANF